MAELELFIKLISEKRKLLSELRMMRGNYYLMKCVKLINDEIKSYSLNHYEVRLG